MNVFLSVEQYLLNFVTEFFLRKWLDQNLMLLLSDHYKMVLREIMLAQNLSEQKMLCYLAIYLAN